MQYTLSSEQHGIHGIGRIELNPATWSVYNPLLGLYRHYISFNGTKVEMNDGRVCEVMFTYQNSVAARLPDGKGCIYIEELGREQLMLLYEQAGGQTAPPSLDFPDHRPVRAKLLPEPIYPVAITPDGDFIVEIVVGSREAGHPDFPMYHMLNAFCNMYVRKKFDLRPNFAAEGGFAGDGFEVHNLTMGYGLRVRYFATSHSQKETNNQERKGHIRQILEEWAWAMDALLRYDWRGVQYESTKDIWNAYCTMQNVLMNFFVAEEITELLAYARKNVIQHAGIPY